MTTRCPAPSALLLHALDATSDPEVAIAMEHVRGCDACRAAIREIRESAALLQAAGSAAATPADCLDEMAIARWLDGAADARDRHAEIAHLAACSECRERLASVSALLLDPTIVSEQARTGASRAPGTRRWRVAGAGALAAAAAVALMVGRPLDRPSDSASARIASDAVGAHRELGMTTTAAPTPIAPLGVAPTADAFRWTSVPRADLYRLTVFDREGATIWRGEGSDTAMAIPPVLAGHETATLYWRVEARTGWDRWVESELVEFSRAPAQRIP